MIVTVSESIPCTSWSLHAWYSYGQCCLCLGIPPPCRLLEERYIKSSHTEDNAVTTTHLKSLHLKLGVELLDLLPQVLVLRGIQSLGWMG